MTRCSEASPSRIAWIVDRIDYDIASFRYRCLIPAYELALKGIESIFATVENLRPTDAEFFVFVKSFSKNDLEFANTLHSADRPFILDICDNILFSDYSPKRNIGDQEKFIAMAAMARGVIVTGDALARVVRDYIPRHLEPIIIPDASFTLLNHLSIFSWFTSMQLRHPQNKQRFLCTRDAMHCRRRDAVAEWIFRSMSFVSKPKSAIVAVKRLYLGTLYDLARRSSMRRPNRRRKLIWFGKHGTSYGKAGMQSLIPVIPYLIEIDKIVPIELVIVSNSRRKYKELFRGLPFPTRYRRWSHEVVFSELLTSDVFLMPNEIDEFSMCKSANRAVMSLAMGVPVVTTWLESIEPLASAVVVDDWEGGLRNYLLDESEKAKSLKVAKDIIGQLFSPGVIGQQWEEALNNVYKARSITGRH